MPEPSSYSGAQQEAIAGGTKEPDWEERAVGHTVAKQGQTGQDLLGEGGRRDERPSDPWPLVDQGLLRQAS